MSTNQPQTLLALPHTPCSLFFGCCLDVMKEIESGSVDMVCADLPYGTTSCKWDSVIPFEPLWAEYKRVCKPNAAIVLTASQPFTSALVMSNLHAFKHEWVWNKKISGNPMLAKRQPLKIHENVLVFSYGTTIYNPIMWEAAVAKRRGCGGKSKLWAGLEKMGEPTKERYPVSIAEFSNGNRARSEIANHPTQKPVALMEYLIRTYSNEGQTVLDNTMGSGTTGVACMNTGRQFIGIERDAEYFRVAIKRISSANHGHHPQIHAHHRRGLDRLVSRSGDAETTTNIYMDNLRKIIESAIEATNTESGSDTPDFILAEYLTDCLAAYDKAVLAREKWYGRPARPKAISVG